MIWISYEVYNAPSIFKQVKTKFKQKIQKITIEYDLDNFVYMMKNIVESDASEFI